MNDVMNRKVLRAHHYEGSIIPNFLRIEHIKTVYKTNRFHLAVRLNHEKYVQSAHAQPNGTHLLNNSWELNALQLPVKSLSS